MFIAKQPKEQQEQYANLLQAVASLSGLFSDSPNPYLYYRSAERAFCKAFEAEDLSREDSSFDAKKNGIGIGLKTFLYKNGSCIEKVAEFNSASNILRDLQNCPEKLILKVAQLRNKRIEFTKTSHGLENGLYHCVARKKGTLSLFECPLESINIEKIKIDPKSIKNNTLGFSDGLNEYKFSLSKSTLLKRFNIKDKIITNIPVSVLEDPFELIQTLLNQNNKLQTKEKYPSVVLPLYSETRGMVPLKSGLNQWNAGGRERHEDEAYIQIPAWIYQKFPTFFPSRDVEFRLELPDGKILQAKPCQDGGIIHGIKAGKALMSSPNKDLGNWILRHVLKLLPGEICTLEILQELGIDSVGITKTSEKEYKINFLPLGSYSEFSQMYK